MKFSCEACGKKYATAETPAPGRVYKIKCKACGHLIVVKASAASQQTSTTELRPPTSPGLPSDAPRVTPPPSPEGHGLLLEIAAPEPHAEAAAAPSALEPLPPEPPPPLPEVAPAGAPTNGAYAGVPEHPDATQEISVATLLGGASEPAAAPAEPPPPEPPPLEQPAETPRPSTEERYVDLFGEAGRADAPAAPEKPADDPFVAAARASLPDGYGKSAGAPDPLAPLRDELETPPPEPLARASTATTTTSAVKVPVIAKPAQQKSSGPIALIAVGALVLVGILGYVLLGGQKAPAPAQAPPVAAAPQPPAPPPPPAPVAPVVAAPPPAPAPAPPPAVEPPTPEKAEKRAAASDEERRAREERRAKEREEKAAREAQAREEKAQREAKAREERDAREREKARAREEKAAAERERARREQEKVAAAGLAEPEGGLTQDQVQKVLSSSRKAFETCIVSSGKSGEVKLDGRRVMLRLNIQPTGAVTYPTLDDVTLNGTELGGCLKSAARVMIFPKFKGDPMHVEVPLVLAGGK